MLERAIAELPGYVKKLLDEVPVVVEDEPSREIRAEMEDLGGQSGLCGLHFGIPLTEQSTFSPGESPTVVMLFRGPIFRLAGESPRERMVQVRITLLHEIAHHFGFTEEDLEAIGYA